MKPDTLFVKRLGRHHIAHLRAVAQGIEVLPSALRYLGIEHGHQAVTAHRQVMQSVRAVTRRHIQNSSWRLIGLRVTTPDAISRPSLEQFIEDNDLDDWSEHDVIQMYDEAYPQDAKTIKRAKSLKRLLELLDQVEALQAQDPKASDMVSDWFDDRTAKRLIAAGFINLGELRKQILAGGRWYRNLPSVGAGKAQRMVAHLAVLLNEPTLAGAEAQPTAPRFSLNEAGEGVQGDRPGVLTNPLMLAAAGPSHEGGPAAFDEAGPAPLTTVPRADTVRSLKSQLAANTDQQAVEAWVKARAGSPATVKVYERAGRRLLLWLRYEKRGLRLNQVTVDDCGDLMAFLQNIPERWISRAQAAPGDAAWAPFKGQLSPLSFKQHVGLVASLFAWLHSTQYIAANPWMAVNMKTGDDPNKKLLDSKAFSEMAATEIKNYVARQAPSASRERMLFIVKFLEAVGLRSAELLNAKLGDFEMEPEGWFMQVHGKGSKNRLAVVPPAAMQALQEYLEARGLRGIEHADPDTPLLASTLDARAPVGYQALYETVKSWIARAVKNSALPAKERQKLSGATTHWLRHTFGTTAIARDVPLDVIQAQMGHASIQTTTAIYGRAPARRRADLLGKAFR